MRNASLFLVVAVMLTVSDSWGQDPPGKDDPVKAEVKRLEGLWLYTHGESGGFTTRVQGFSPALLFEGDKVTEGRVFPGRDIQKFGSGPYKLDPSKDPKTVDFTLKEKDQKEVTRLGIYKLEKDKLVMSFSEPGAKERPQEFDQKKARIEYYVRSKK